MRVAVRAVGRPKAGGLASAIASYEERAARYWPLDLIEVREGGARGGDAAGVRRLEGERLLDGLPAGALVVACDPGGEAFDSPRFAAWLQGERERARDVAFMIGGAHGLDGAVLARAVRRLSLAPWTSPHELARLVLAEQLYRAGTIVRGEPYHK